jgi:hypothetical protein
MMCDNMLSNVTAGVGGFLQKAKECWRQHGALVLVSP